MLHKRLQANTTGRDFVIGDLHGSFSCLLRALDGVKFDFSRDRLIAVGDLIDYGPENEKCLSLLQMPWFFSARGNHEQAMGEFFHPAENSVYRKYWLSNCGWWTAAQKTLDSAKLETIKRLAAVAKELPLVITVDLPSGKKFHVMHAEPIVNCPITDDDFEDGETLKELFFEKTELGLLPVWETFTFYDLYRLNVTEEIARLFLKCAESFKLDRIFSEELSHIYNGHTSVQRPTRFVGMTDLDTMAFGSYYQSAPNWAGLTITEPATDRFWKATETTFNEVKPLILK